MAYDRTEPHQAFPLASRFMTLCMLLFAIEAWAQVPVQAHSVSQPKNANFGSAAALSFLPAITYDSGGRGADSIAVDDVNGDGHPDLIVTNSGSNSVSVLLGNGDGTFQAAASYFTGGVNPWSVAVADLNGDGHLDLAIATFSGTLSVLLNKGDGKFQSPIIYNSGTYYAFYTAVGDLNGDGKPDVVVAAWCVTASCDHGALSVLLGNGDGTLQNPVIYNSGGWQAYSVAIGDLNGDGRPDLVAANRCQSIGNCNNGSLTVLAGNGEGTFQSAVSYNAGGSGSELVLIGDINGDHVPDLVVSNDLRCSNCSDAGVGVLLGKGDGTFRSPISYSSGGLKGFSGAISDVNGDGHPDVVVANVLSNTVGVLLGNGDGTFRSAVTFVSGGVGPYSVALKDVNGDGKPDLLVANCSAGFCAPNAGEGVIGVLLNNTPFCTTAPVITVSATPMFLWPPNRRVVPVTVTGAIRDPGCIIETASYAVTDEYSEIQPAGPLTLGPGGAYSFTVSLQASRRGTDLDGRSYKVTVRTENNAGQSGSKMIEVVVPHDQAY